MANPTQYGNFVPTSNVWDVSQVNALRKESDELKELLVRLYQNLNLMSLSLNLRDAGYYDTQEFVNGQLYFPNPANTGATAARPDYRQVYRKVINFGPLPVFATKLAPHGITVTPKTTFTRMYGCATMPLLAGTASFIPLPFASIIINENISLRADETNVYVTDDADYSAYTITYIILEYLQS